MRVIEPKIRHRPKRQTKLPKKPFVYLGMVIILLGALGIGLKSMLSIQHHEEPAKPAVMNQNIAAAEKTGKLKTFTGEEFKDLYNNFAYPNTARINENTPITGNNAADAHIKAMAKERGYAIRSAPVTNAFQSVGKGFLLQQRAAQPWEDLKAAALRDGIHIGLAAAYRSAEEQKRIFLDRLNVMSIPIDGIASGMYDAEIAEVLKTTAIPGYSRHHTGYTIDIACEDQPTTSFMYTNCFQWLSANNYEKAKTYGWIPSYPEEADRQGPDPESWEYVWFGVDAVTE